MKLSNEVFKNKEIFLSKSYYVPLYDIEDCEPMKMRKSLTGSNS